MTISKHDETKYKRFQNNNIQNFTYPTVNTGLSLNTTKNYIQIFNIKKILLQNLNLTKN